MVGDNRIMIERIDERLRALGLSDRKASLAAVDAPDLIRDIRRGSRPRAQSIASLARVLGVSTDYLHGAAHAPMGIVSAPMPAEDRPVPVPSAMPQDIPVFGTALAAERDFTVEFDGNVAVAQINLNTGEVIDRFRRPPTLANRRDIYGLYVAGDSMEPKFESGQGIIVDPRRPPNTRDYVVVYLRAEDDGAAAVLIKRLVRRSSTFLELEQFNPPARFRLTSQQYRDVHRIIPWDEVFGV